MVTCCTTFDRGPLIDTPLGHRLEMEEDYWELSLPTCERGHDSVPTPKHLECFGIHVLKYPLDDAFEDAKTNCPNEPTVP